MAAGLVIRLYVVFVGHNRLHVCCKICKEHFRECAKNARCLFGVQGALEVEKADAAAQDAVRDNHLGLHVLLLGEHHEGGAEVLHARGNEHSLVGGRLGRGESLGNRHSTQCVAKPGRLDVIKGA